MKIVLFLAAVYALIINQYHKKTALAPSPTPTPVEEIRAERKDSTHSSATFALYLASPKKSRDLPPIDREISFR